MELTVVAAVFCSGNEVLCLRRAAGRSMAGLWEFPGGKVEPGETLTQALVREIREELQVDIEVGNYLGENLHAPEPVAGNTAPPMRIRLHAFQIDSWTGQFELTDHDKMLWGASQQIRSLQWSPADVPFVELLCERSSGAS